MTPENILAYRLHQQQIMKPQFKTPAEVVGWLGAIQAQDYSGAKWSIGLRLPESTDAQIEQGFAERSIIRTWLMRGTLHITAADDIHWMRTLFAPRLIAASAGRCKQLELDDALFSRCQKLFSAALQEGQQLTRDAMYALLERENISTKGQRGYHILWRHAQEGLICHGPMQGKQPTFVLLNEYVPATEAFDRDKALAALATKYFTSRGPATLQDFVWWSGLKVSEARKALEAVSPQFTSETIGKQTYWVPSTHSDQIKCSPSLYLLPGFDEYILGYQDRSSIVDAQYAPQICPGNNGMFMPTIVLNGHVDGTWKRALKKSTVTIALNPFSHHEIPRETIEKAAERYGQFLGVSAEIQNP